MLTPDHAFHRRRVIRRLLQVHEPIFRVVPVRQGKEVVEMRRDVRLAAAVRLQHRHEDKLLGSSLDRRAREDAPRAQQLEGLDLDSARRAVEVPREDAVCDLRGGAEASHAAAAAAGEDSERRDGAARGSRLLLRVGDEVAGGVGARLEGRRAGGRGGGGGGGGLGEVEERGCEFFEGGAGVAVDDDAAEAECLARDLRSGWVSVLLCIQAQLV